MTTSPQALARALRERLDRTRSFIQDTMDTQHVPRGAISNLMSARDEVDATVSNLTALVTWALETEARNAELAQALLGMQQAAGLALEALPADQQDGTVGTFLATIHRHCASALSLGHGGDFEASAIAGKQS